MIAGRAAIGLALLLCANAARADSESDARARADEGAALFQRNEFAAAASKFSEAYELNHDPSYLFNVAQAYRHAGDCVRAADYYGRFLGEVPHPPNEDKIRVWYASQMQCAKERTAGQPIERGKPAPPPPATAPVVPPPEPQSRRHVLVIGLAATGIAALGFGGFFAWDASFLADRRASLRDERCTLERPCPSALVNDYDRRGARADRLAAVGFAVGGVALAASATLYFLSRSERTPIAITPIRGGAVVGGTFVW